jgi:hypothetical protein
MQYLEDSGTPVLYIGRTVLKVKKKYDRQVKNGFKWISTGQRAVCGKCGDTSSGLNNIRRLSRQARHL